MNSLLQLKSILEYFDKFNIFKDYIVYKYEITDKV